MVTARLKGWLIEDDLGQILRKLQKNNLAGIVRIQEPQPTRNGWHSIQDLIDEVSVQWLAR